MNKRSGALKDQILDRLQELMPQYYGEVLNSYMLQTLIVAADEIIQDVYKTFPEEVLLYVQFTATALGSDIKLQMTRKPGLNERQAQLADEFLAPSL